MNCLEIYEIEEINDLINDYKNDLDGDVFYIIDTDYNYFYRFDEKEEIIHYSNKKGKGYGRFKQYINDWKNEKIIIEYYKTKNEIKSVRWLGLDILTEDGGEDGGLKFKCFIPLLDFDYYFKPIRNKKKRKGGGKGYKLIDKIDEKKDGFKIKKLEYLVESNYNGKIIVRCDRLTYLEKLMECIGIKEEQFILSTYEECKNRGFISII